MIFWRLTYIYAWNYRNIKNSVSPTKKSNTFLIDDSLKKSRTKKCWSLKMHGSVETIINELSFLLSENFERIRGKIFILLSNLITLKRNSIGQYHSLGDATKTSLKS